MRRPSGPQTAGTEARTAAEAALRTGADASPQPAAPTAFFDVDNTLLRGASIYHFARGLAARDLFTTRDLTRFAWGQLVFRLTGTEQRAHINAAREAALAFVAGHRVSELVELCEDIYEDSMSDRIWSGARTLVERHRAAGHNVWLVTATPVELADILARRLGLTGALGTVAESVDGVYTGRLIGDLLHGPAKAEAVAALSARTRLDLSTCAAYSDSYNDLPLLSMVGHPNAVNPDPELYRHARMMGWPVHEFRRHRATLRVGLPAAAAGAVAGGLTVGLVRRWRRRPGN
ncbi:HAD-IB family hydrolase [Lipingzhangella sp. LS1_29]|uniref:HAD-IB family hydrolase n=1 Tax=Lipingzhangella rawalii TaxID=2055835 RepID=A0ABU2HAQ3_9ACTN|nr:HAD-IB family hydrolase [Lipingzhangella rawalii]MDS1271910.1 HAD-IB family hydrolase [Lipingzhangella rawalii]